MKKRYRFTCPHCGSPSANSTTCRAKHGESGTPLYQLWQASKRRWGKYGIHQYYTPPAEWDECYITFRDWARDNNWSPGSKLMRRDYTKGFGPLNCYWTGSARPR